MAELMISLTHPNVHDILQQLTFSESPFLLVETMEHDRAKEVLGRKTYVIFDYHNDAEYNVDAYASGRVFDAAGELKWQQENGEFHLVYIGDATQVEILKDFGKNTTKPHELQKPRENSFPLWGHKIAKDRVRTEMQFQEVQDEDADNIFLELEVSQYLRYPVPAANNARVQLHSREYDDKNGNLQYYRFCNCTSMHTE